MTILELIATFVGRAQRADAKSQNPHLPKDQRDFHAGRREAYLQAIALMGNTNVGSIRTGVLGTRRREAPTVRSVHRDFYAAWGEED